MDIKIYKNLFNVLEAKQKIRIAYFGIFVIIIMILETFSLGMFYPFLQSITNNLVNPKLTEYLLFFNSKVNLSLNIELTALLIFAIIIVLKNFIILKQKFSKHIFRTIMKKYLILKHLFISEISIIQLKCSLKHYKM